MKNRSLEYKLYYEKNKAKKLASAAVYRANNGENAKHYRDTHKEEKQIHNKIYYANNRDKVLARTSKNKKRKRASEDTEQNKRTDKKRRLNNEADLNLDTSINKMYSPDYSCQFFTEKKSSYDVLKPHAEEDQNFLECFLTCNSTIPHK